MKMSADRNMIISNNGNKLRCIICCAVLSCLCICFLFGCRKPDNVVRVEQETVVLPFGTEIEDDGTIVLPFGTEINEDGTISVDSNGAESDAVGADGIETDVDAVQPSEEASDILRVPASILDVLGYAGVTNSLPAVFIFTDDGEGITSREDYHPCSVYTVNDPSGTELMSARTGVRLRGNSTAEYGDASKVLKKQVPYRIKFDEKTNMMGLNNGVKRKSWVLLKYDWGGVNDRTVFELSKVFLHDYLYCSDSTVVRGYVNGEYKGLYLLCEQNQTGKGRVQINEPAEGYSGTDIGYFLELDNYCEDPCVKVDYANATITDLYGVTRKITDAYYSIKSDIYDDAQVKFIKKYLNNVFKIVYEACENGRYYGLDSRYEMTELSGNYSAEEVCGKVLDIDSIVDMYLVHETGCSSDCGEGSFYMCVDFSKGSRFDRLTFTAPWDFNWPADCRSDEYWAAVFRKDNFVRSYGDRSNPWFVLLMKQDWFVERVANRWKEVREEALQCLKNERTMLEKLGPDMDKCDGGTTTGWASDRQDRIGRRLEWFDELYK